MFSPLFIRFVGNFGTRLKPTHNVPFYYPIQQNKGITIIFLPSLQGYSSILVLFEKIESIDLVLEKF